MKCEGVRLCVGVVALCVCVRQTFTLFNIQWSCYMFNARARFIFLFRDFEESRQHGIRFVCSFFFLSKYTKDHRVPHRFITRILQLHFMYFKLYFVTLIDSYIFCSFFPSFASSRFSFFFSSFHLISWHYYFVLPHPSSTFNLLFCSLFLCSFFYTHRSSFIFFCTNYYVNKNKDLSKAKKGILLKVVQPSFLVRIVK